MLAVMGGWLAGVVFAVTLAEIMLRSREARYYDNIRSAMEAE